MMQMYSTEGSLLSNTIPQDSDAPVPHWHILQKAGSANGFTWMAAKATNLFYRDGILTPKPRRNKCTSVLGDCADNISVKYMSCM